LTAVLRLVTPHAYFYVEDGADVSDEDLEKAGRAFEEGVYPTIVDNFGPEWTPGVDSDPRITILHAGLHGLSGYFSSHDEVPRAASPYSNEREMVYLHLGSDNPGSDGYNGLLAHELQHLVHWHADPSEETWVNEGLSEVAREMLDGSMCKKGKNTAGFILEWMDTTAFSSHIEGSCPDRTCSAYIEYRIISGKCTLCGECLTACKYGAVHGEKKQAFISGYKPFEIRQTKCVKCGECIKVCKEGAIKLISAKEMAEAETVGA
jgi:NAD-dependent dihydropyrimidine dehydrogenase PreA subunit